MGHIVYKKQMWKKEFYSLNFCNASDEQKHNITTFDEVTEYDPQGANIYDEILHRHFIKAQVVNMSHTVQPCMRTLNETERDNFKWAIRNGGRYKLYLDGLPSATRFSQRTIDGSQPINYQDGIPLGAYIPAAKSE